MAGLADPRRIARQDDGSAVGIPDDRRPRDLPQGRQRLSIENPGRDVAAGLWEPRPARAGPSNARSDLAGPKLGIVGRDGRDEGPVHGFDGSFGIEEAMLAHIGLLERRDGTTRLVLV